MNRKGIQEEGMKFNIKRISRLILLITLILIGLLIFAPVVSAEIVTQTVGGFGKYIYSVLTGGLE